MNETIILAMVKPYIADNTISNKEFEMVFDMLSQDEKKRAVEILARAGIYLIDKENTGDDETFILEIEAGDGSEESDFEGEDADVRILYDERLFKDKDYIESLKDGWDANARGPVKLDNITLCAMIQNGDKQAIQSLCIKNKGLVDKWAAKYQKAYHNRLDFEDLVQVGFMGMIKAAFKFDTKLGYSFSTYAVWWIRQAISREIMDHGYAIRIPVHMMERINKVSRLEDEVSDKDIEDRVSYISNETGLSEDAVTECMILRTNIVTYASLNTSVGEDSDAGELMEFIPSDEIIPVEDAVSKKELRERLITALETLTDKEQRVLRLRFGIDDGRARTLEEVGREFNVTRERIRQIEAKALRKLRHPARSRKLKDFLD